MASGNCITPQPRLRKLGLLGCCLLLGACQGPSLPGATGDPSILSQVAQLEVQSQPLPGGFTFADLQKDTSWQDSFDPKVPVRFSASDHLVDGVATNAVLEVRGKSTRLAPQKSFRIALDRNAAPWRGLHDVLLNKHPYDHSRLRNRLSFELFQDFPILLAPKTAWAQLKVDGQDLGLFTQIERLDPRYLERRHLDSQSSLYKAEAFEFLRHPDELKASSDAGYDKAQFEKRLEIQGGKEHGELLSMLDAVNDPKISTDAVMARFNRDNYLTWFAANILADNVDTSSQNFYLFRPKGEGALWSFIPWDFDGAWGYYRPDEPRSGRLGRIGRAQEGAANWWNVRLHRRVLRDEGWRAALLARMEELLAGPFSPGSLQARLAKLKPVVASHLAAGGVDAQQLRAAKVDPLPQLDAEVALIPQVPAQAHARFLDSLKRPMPIFLGDPERQDGQVRFMWEASTDLQGDELSYTLLVGQDPGFQKLVLKREGLKSTSVVVPLPPGLYYWSVEVQDAQGNWQLPFDRYWDPSTDTRYHGLKRSELL